MHAAQARGTDDYLVDGISPTDIVIVCLLTNAYSATRMLRRSDAVALGKQRGLPELDEPGAAGHPGCGHDSVVFPVGLRHECGRV